jgi:hypothetical protein
MLMRQPTTTAPARQEPAILSAERVPDNADQVIVLMNDNTRYLVERRPEARVVADPGATRVSLESDDRRVWMRIAWCRGTQGQIDVGTNPQGALSDLMQTVGREITSGGGTTRIIRAIREAELEPFAEVDIARSREWRITAQVGVALNSAGFQGVTGRAELDVGWMRVGLQGSLSDPQGEPQGQVGLTFTFDLGPRQAPERRCDPQVVDLFWAYSCQRQRQETVELEGPLLPRHAEETRFVYFNYATADIDGARSGGELEHVRDLLSRGYRVTQVEGFTSPEGPQGASRRFMGNVALADARAQAAVAAVGQRCPEGRVCMDPAASVTGRSERPPLTRTVRRRGREEEVELEGRELEAAVAAQFTADEAEMGRLPAEEQERIRTERNTHRKAELIYPWLRRVEIRLRRDWLQRGPPVRTTVWSGSGRSGCPEDVRQAAVRVWFPPRPRR